MENKLIHPVGQIHSKSTWEQGFNITVLRIVMVIILKTRNIISPNRQEYMSLLLTPKTLYENKEKAN